MLLTVATVISDSIVVGEKAHAVIPRNELRVLLDEVW